MVSRPRGRGPSSTHAIALGTPSSICLWLSHTFYQLSVCCWARAAVGSTPPPASDPSRGAEGGSTAQALPTTNVSEYGLGPLP